MRHIKTVVTAFALLALSLGTQAADLRLNGAGIHYAVTEEIYIGALYLEAPASTTEEAINLPGAKRMEMRILAESWRSRSFATAWLQLISINNPLDEVNAIATDVQAFSNILEDKLQFGDSVRIDLTPGEGIQVAINDVPVLLIKNEAFFDLLLRSWLGKRSPSNDFTRNLLQVSNDNTDIVDRFDVTLPEPGRKDAIALWASASLLAAPQAVAQTAAAAPVAAAKPVVSAPKPAPVPVAEPAPEPAPVAVAAKPEPAPEPEPAAVAAKPEPAPKPEPAAVAAKPEPAQVAEPEKPDVDIATLEKTYRAYILRDTYKRVRYPQRAASRNQEGEVVVTLTVGRDGNLLKVDIKEKSYPLLNSAAEEAVTSAAPYPAVPEDLPGDTFTFDIPIKFKIPR